MIFSTLERNEPECSNWTASLSPSKSPLKKACLVPTRPAILRLDPDLADEVVDVDGLLLAEAVDPPDPLLEDGGIPGELQVDHAVGGVLEVEADAAGVAGEEEAVVRVVVELDDVLGPPTLALGAGEEAGAEAVLGEQVAHGPVRQREHPPPLAEDDDLAALPQHELPDQLPELQQLGGREALDHALLGGALSGSPARPPRSGAGPGRWR